MSVAILVGLTTVSAKAAPAPIAPTQQLDPSEEVAAAPAPVAVADGDKEAAEQPGEMTEQTVPPASSLEAVDNEVEAAASGEEGGSIEGDAFDAETRPEAASGARVMLPEEEGPVDTSELGVLSEGGTNSGALPLALGSIVGLISASLIANGVYQLIVGLDRAARCVGDAAFNDPQCVSVDTAELRYASSGLSFVFAIPTAVAAGLWIRRGIRVNRDYRAVRGAGEAKLSPTLQLHPYVGRRGRAGLSVRLRF
ncbi:MAG: hypothetical protein ACPHRO_01810 [Nannocystaceae bacterium]